MEDLFADDIRLRASAASRYRVFPNGARIPGGFLSEWHHVLGDKLVDEGLEWPEHLAIQTRDEYWPEFAFGTANAACVLVMHRPGLDRDANSMDDVGRPAYIPPRFPVLGGIAHAHNALFHEKYLPNNRTWNYIHKFLRPVFDALQNPWSQIMTCNLNTQPGHHGEVDQAINQQGLELLDRVVVLCQPKIILLCGGEVHKATEHWRPPSGTRLARVAHPSMWHRTAMQLPNGHQTAKIAVQALS